MTKKYYLLAFPDNNNHFTQKFILKLSGSNGTLVLQQQNLLLTFPFQEAKNKTPFKGKGKNTISAHASTLYLLPKGIMKDVK